MTDNTAGVCRVMVGSDCARRARRSLRSLRSQRKRSRIRAAIVALRLHDTAAHEYSRTGLITCFPMGADIRPDPPLL
jgi:hypothetical protein